MDHREEAPKAGSESKSSRPEEARRDAVSEAFGEVLQRRRHEAGLTQAQLAEASGLHDTYISFLERGLRQPSLEVVLRLAEALESAGSSFVREVEEGLQG